VSEIALGRKSKNLRKEREIRLGLKDLYRHQYVLGATGTGKTTLLIREVLQAHRNGMCTWVLEPHGDLSHDLVERCRPEDLESVYLFDPLRVGFSLNPFELPGYGTREQREMMVEKIIGETVSFMQRLYGRQYWGPSLNRIFQDALRTLYGQSDAPTFGEMLDLVEEKLGEEEYEGFYEELDRLPKGRTDAVVNKVKPFVENRVLSRIFNRKQSSIDLNSLLRGKKLVIWRLPKGELSELNTGLIALTLLNKLWYSVSLRKDRYPLLLAADEFQNFSFGAMGSLLTEGRKFRVGLLLSHQHTGQVSDRLLGDVLGNAATWAVFRVAGKDASRIAENLERSRKAELTERLTSLPDGKALVKMRSSFGKLPKPPVEVETFRPPLRKNRKVGTVLERMRKLYAREKKTEERGKEDDRLLALLRIVGGLPEASSGATLQEFRKIDGSTRGSEVAKLAERGEKQGFITIEEVKQKRGRPKKVFALTEQGREKLMGSSTKAGGKEHRYMVNRLHNDLAKKGYRVVVPTQAGPGEQPDLLALDWKGNETAYEVETRAHHPKQVKENFRKNFDKGRQVVFVVPGKKVQRRVEKILGDEAELVSFLHT